MKKAILLIVIGAVFFVSCDKSTDINIITPKEGDNFHTGDMVEVKAKVYDPDALSAVLLTATSQTGDTIYHSHTNTSGQDYTLIKSFQLTQQGICHIKINTWGGYGGSKSISVNVN